MLLIRGALLYAALLYVVTGYCYKVLLVGRYLMVLARGLTLVETACMTWLPDFRCLFWRSTMALI